MYEERGPGCIGCVVLILAIIGAVTVYNRVKDGSDGSSGGCSEVESYLEDSLRFPEESNTRTADMGTGRFSMRTAEAEAALVRVALATELAREFPTEAADFHDVAVKSHEVYLQWLDEYATTGRVEASTMREYDEVNQDFRDGIRVLATMCAD